MRTLIYLIAVTSISCVNTPSKDTRLVDLDGEERLRVCKKHIRDTDVCVPDDSGFEIEWHRSEDHAACARDLADHFCESATIQDLIDCIDQVDDCLDPDPVDYCRDYYCADEFEAELDS